jgi:hypothetical protein
MMDLRSGWPHNNPNSPSIARLVAKEKKKRKGHALQYSHRLAL